MRNPNPILCSFLLGVTAVTSSAATGDADNDGLRDGVETNTGIFRSASDTGTNPYVSDTDGDSMPDGMEVSLGTDPTNSGSKIKRPNIIYIMADDLAYGELGCFGQNQRTGIWKFQTPGLDSMAAEGAMLTHHYASAPICVSSRCSFLEGRSQGHASIRDGQFDFPIPTGHLLASTLKQAGYKTIHIGKAGLTGKDQFKPTAHPMDRGFDHFFGLLTHAECHEHYPRNGTTETKATIYNDRNPVTGAHMDLYTSDAWTGYAKNNIIQESQSNPDRPFFIYLAYDTPHFWGSTPPTKAYPTGRGLNGGIQWTGAPSYVNTATNDPTKVNNPANIHSSVSSSWYPDAQKYVTMIRRLDDSVADILQTLRDLGIADNTLVVFTSDNGASQIGYDPRSFGGYGDFEGIKGDLLEGGIRVPTIAWWPNTIPATQSVSNIRKIDRPSANYDWLATFAAAAKFPIPAYTDGTSLLPSLTGAGAQFNRGFLYFEMYTSGNTPDYPEFPNHRNRPRGNMQAIRIGDFMGIRTAISSPTDPFMIYDVAHDPRQSVNLAASQPQLQNEMQRLAVGARRPVSSTNRPYDNALIPAVHPANPLKDGLKWKSYEGYWPCLPDFRTLSPTSTGGVASINPSVRSRDTDVGLFFEGYISIETAGNYTFQIASSAESALWIHEAHVIDNDFGYAAVKNSTPVQLSTGLHPIRLYYRHRTGTPTLELRYSVPGMSMRQVPESALFQDGKPTTLHPDTITITRGNQTIIDVLANDDADVPLALDSSSSPRFGTAEISGNRIIYTPNSGMIGVDRFEYTANDGVALSKTEVTVTILAEQEIWFPFDEGKGQTVTQKGAIIPATGIMSGPIDPQNAWIRGKFGHALHFRGYEDLVTFSNLSLPMGGAPRTFSCWIRTPAGTAPENQAIFSYGSNSFGGRFTIRLTPMPGNASLQTVSLETEGGMFSGNFPVNDGSWHHLLLSASDLDENGLTTLDEARLFIDGNRDAGRIASFGILMTSAGPSPTLGGSGHSDSYNFLGQIDDLRIFQRAVTPEEIAYLSTTIPQSMDSGQGGSNSSLDSDGDRFTDDQEFTAGTNPNDGTSFPRIDSMFRSRTGLRLTWNGIAGRIYRIQESQDLKSWRPVPDAPEIALSSNNPETSVTFAADSSSKRFFRLQVELATAEQIANTAQNPANTLDSDLDGLTNDEEFIAGTEPFDPRSKLSLRILSISPEGILITWDAVAGRTYRIEQSVNLVDWSPAPGVNPVLAQENQSGVQRLIPADGSPKRFLRLGVSITN